MVMRTQPIGIMPALHLSPGTLGVIQGLTDYEEGADSAKSTGGKNNQQCRTNQRV